MEKFEAQVIKAKATCVQDDIGEEKNVTDDLFTVASQVLGANYVPFPIKNLIAQSDWKSSCKLLCKVRPDECKKKCLIDTKDRIDPRYYSFFKLVEISSEDNVDQRELLEYVISSIGNEDFNFVYVLSGQKDRVNLYLGICEGYRKNLTTFDPSSFAEILKHSFLGAFPSSHLLPIDASGGQAGVDFTADVFDKMALLKRKSAIVGIPTLRENAAHRDIVATSTDRLINGMRGDDWMLMVVCEPVSQQDIHALFKDVRQAYSTISVLLKKNTQLSRGASGNFSSGENDSRSKSEGGSKSSDKASTNHGTQESHGTSTQCSVGYSTNSSVSYEQSNLAAKGTLQYIEEILIKRLTLGLSQGLFRSSVYTMAKDRLSLERLNRLTIALFQGGESSHFPLQAISFPEQGRASKKAETPLNHFQGLASNWTNKQLVPALWGLESEHGYLRLSTLLTAREVSILAGLPVQEVPGIAVRESVDFGLNPSSGEDGIDLGAVLHRTFALSQSRIKIDRSMLSKHLFIAGVTGSGKTTTCQRLLLESDLPFLVIEPAKTEYRAILERAPDVTIFTLGNEHLAPFRFNPFQLLKSESISSHVDMLKAAFCAAFPMEAAMPFLLEEAIYRAYEDFGWRVDGWDDVSEANSYCDDPWQNPDGWLYWPTMDNLIQAIEKVIKEKKFDTRLENDYRASLVSRLKNWCIGAKGQMLNCKLSIDFNDLLEGKFVLEMEDLRDPNDKALMMGLILARLREAAKARYVAQGKGQNYLVLVEEAHRLLSKPMPNDGEARRQAVEMFCDMLAEVRKYDVGLVIADQIPEKLAPDVLKNTNTKIIHKLFAKDDRESVGDAMAMTDEQKSFLTRLRVGEAVMFTGNWDKSIHVKVDADTNTTAGKSHELEAALKHSRSRFYQNRATILLPGAGVAAVGAIDYRAASQVRKIGQLLDKQLRHLHNRVVHKKEIDFQAESRTIKDHFHQLENLGLPRKTALQLCVRQLDSILGTMGSDVLPFSGLDHVFALLEKNIQGFITCDKGQVWHFFGGSSAEETNFFDDIF